MIKQNKRTYKIVYTYIQWFLDAIRAFSKCRQSQFFKSVIVLTKDQDDEYGRIWIVFENQSQNSIKTIDRQLQRLQINVEIKPFIIKQYFPFVQEMIVRFICGIPPKHLQKYLNYQLKKHIIPNQFLETLLSNEKIGWTFMKDLCFMIQKLIGRKSKSRIIIFQQHKLDRKVFYILPILLIKENHWVLVTFRNQKVYVYNSLYQININHEVKYEIKKRLNVDIDTKTNIKIQERSFPQQDNLYDSGRFVFLGIMGKCRRLRSWNFNQETIKQKINNLFQQFMLLE